MKIILLFIIITSYLSSNSEKQKQKQILGKSVAEYSIQYRDCVSKNINLKEIIKVSKKEDSINEQLKQISEIVIKETERVIKNDCSEEFKSLSTKFFSITSTMEKNPNK